MRKCFKVASIILTIILILSMLSGCGASTKSDVYNESFDTITESVSGNLAGSSNSVNKGEVMEDVEYESADSDNDKDDVSTNRKIIEKIYLTVQTKEFDNLLEKLEAEIKSLCGYIEKSSISGNTYEEKGNRYANFVIRIPSAKTDTLTEFVSKNSTITNKEVDTEDVTLSYVDMESRVKALETEKATLERLLADAKTMADVISIQDRLTDVIYEIESYKSKLRTYDNLIEYTTITVRISEVERVQVVEEQSIWQEIKTDFKENLEDIGYMFERLFVGIIGGLPYIIINVVVILAIIIIIKKIVKKNKKKESKVLPTNTNSTPIEKPEKK